MRQRTPERYQRVLQRFAAHVPVKSVGTAGVLALYQSTILLCGFGRIGSMVAAILRSLGIGTITANDPQILEPDNNLVFAYPHQVGTPKVAVAEQVFSPDPDIRFKGVVAPNGAPAVEEYAKSADLIVSAANTWQGRIDAEKLGRRFQKPVFSVAVTDGREQRVGLILYQRPDSPWRACTACFLPQKTPISRGEGLLFSVIAATAALATQLVADHITNPERPMLVDCNLFVLDLDGMSLRALAVERLPDCPYCSPCGRGANMETCPAEGSVPAPTDIYDGE